MILTLIAWTITILMSVITFIIEIPLKLICGIISIVFLSVIAIISPLIKESIKISNKTEKKLLDFIIYGITIKKWLFPKVYRSYKKTIL